MKSEATGAFTAREGRGAAERPYEMAKFLFRQPGAILIAESKGPGSGVSVPMNEGNYRPESRMRENRLSGLEGGVARAIPTPILAVACHRVVGVIRAR